MTLERASDLVLLMKDMDMEASNALFLHFVLFFGLNRDPKLVEMFGRMCGYTYSGV